MQSKNKYNPNLFGFDVSEKNNYVVYPYFDQWKEQEKIANLINNLEIPKKKIEHMYDYTQEKFFSNSYAAIQTRKKRNCKKLSGQNDFALYLCKMQKSYQYLTLTEIILIIFFLFFLIKINVQL